MKTRMLFALLLVGCVSACAESQVRGKETRGWLAYQKAPPNQTPARGLSGEAGDRVYQRYLQSFTRPIPERFERDRTSSDSTK
jgi:hypothetical protein